MMKDTRYYFIVGFVALSFSISLVSPLRKSLQNYYLNQNQEVLSVVKNYPASEGLKVDVFKIRRGNRLFLEIYSSINGEILQKINLVEAQDSYFYFNGKSTNMFFNDLNGDKKPELIVPIFNKNLFSSLQVFSFNEEQHLFHVVNTNFL